MKTYRELVVWQKAMTLITLVYQQLTAFPDAEKFGLSSQIKRYAVSIPSNIAEGYGRHSRKDYSRFLQISRGSLYECQTQLEIASNLGFTNLESKKDIVALSIEIEKMLNSLIRKLESDKSLIPFPLF